MLSRDLNKIQNASPVSSDRLLPSFDSYVIGFRPRELFVPEKRLSTVFRPQAWVSPVLLVDGRVAGTWELEKSSSNRLHIKLFTRLSPVRKRELSKEVDKLGTFLDRDLTVLFSGP